MRGGLLIGISIVEVLLTGRGARGRIWGTGLSDLTIESFHSTRTGLKPSAEGFLTRCVVGHQEGGGADVPKLKLGLEMLSSLDTVCVVWCAGGSNPPTCRLC
ncbi:hypothetical protein FJTKL_00136 [Diaporthe vaccinii]|uniref:Polyketide synthase n=1 Tax=Diaporthe vaccinii TaxID=105482 RepID=A0ABR4E4D3_9PEZI